MILATLVFMATQNPVALSGWVVQFNPNSLISLEKNAPKLRHVLPEWIKCTVDGRAVRRDEFPWAGYLKARDIAKKAGCKVFGMASNYLNELGGFKASPVQAFLYSANKRKAHVEAMVKICVDDKLDGIDVDYESLESKDKDAYSRFMDELGSALRKQGKLLSTAVHPKEEDKGNWDGPQAQDYRRLGKAADFVRLMCYDYSWDTSEPGPIAPLDWAERVVKYAASVIPPSKLEIGIPAYGYDWTKKPATSLTFPDWKDRSRALDPRSQEYVDGKSHFAGAATVKPKQDLARKYSIPALAMWYVGSEDPEMWKFIPARKKGS
ncbi:MAG: hypothetical protein H7Y17_14365 [Chlorobia bacterium]|nr:hypothetical protein [Fimbriimonadaceae bacterium]